MKVCHCKRGRKYLPVLLCAASTCSTTLARAEENAPLEKHEYAAVQVPIIGATATDAPAIIDKLRSGELKAEAAWQSGELKLDDVLYLLGHYFDPWGGIDWQGDGDVRLPLAKLIVQHAPEKLQQPAELPLRVRLWVGDYLQSVNDERAVPLLESVLSEFKEAKKDQDPAVFQAAERLASYYQGEFEFEKAAQSWLGVVPLHDASDWRVPDAQIQAARMYARAGNSQSKEKVNQLYQQAIESKHEYFTALALWDQSSRLMGDGKYLQVRELLLPVLGINDEKQQNEKTSQIYLNETGQIFLLTLLASSYYHTGEFDASLKYANRATSLYQSLNPIPEGTGVEGVAGMAYELVQWVGQWRKHPLIVVSKEIALSQNANEQDIKIRSFSKRELKVSSSDPRIRTVMKGDWEEKELGLYFERVLTVSLPKDYQTGTAAVVTVSDVSEPNQKFTVDVLFKVEG